MARGNEKGRGERAIRYVRDNFFAARSFADIGDLNAQADLCCAGRASNRPCPEDTAMNVREAFEAEQPLLIIFPEGTRGEPERVQELKTGVAVLAAKYPQAPVVPVFMHGLGKSMSKISFIPVPFFVDACIGVPLEWSVFFPNSTTGKPTDGEERKSSSDFRVGNWLQICTNTAQAPFASAAAQAEQA